MTIIIDNNSVFTIPPAEKLTTLDTVPPQVATRMLSTPGLRTTARQRRNYEQCRNRAYSSGSPLRRQGKTKDSPGEYIFTDGAPGYTAQRKMSALSLTKLAIIVRRAAPRIRTELRHAEKSSLTAPMHVAEARRLHNRASTAKEIIEARTCTTIAPRL